MLDTFDFRAAIQRYCWSVLIGFLAVFLAYLLAANAAMMLVAGLGTVWLMLLPYHCEISIRVAIATFTSALILPFFPGRPFVWEFAALLGWTGLAVVLSVRRQHQAMQSIIRSNLGLFLGVIGYCIILLITMYYRGFGLRILGSEQMGGRFYFQQLACAIFPLLFAARPLNEQTLTRLFYLQCLLSATYLVSDFVFSFAPKGLLFLLQFFELPNDALAFEIGARGFGIRRFQSLYIISTGLLYLLLARHNLRDFFSRKGIFLIPLSCTLFGVGLLSGHRYLSLILAPTLFFCAFAQRFSNLKHNLIVCVTGAVVMIFIYAFASDLPLAAQRAVSFLPGIQVSKFSQEDASSTLEMRRILRRLGMDMAPEYLWIGRGLGQSAAADYSWQWDPTGVSTHINTGRFYNGFVGLLVNTGMFGTGFMMLFLGAGSVLAWKIIQYLRTHGCEDAFARICSLFSSLWMANVVAFLFFHGDSEWAMKTFSLQAGLLLACYFHLQQRLTISK
jgi:hypothetical protein